MTTKVMTTKVAVLVGSLRKDSYNRRLAQALEKLAPDDFKFNFIQIDDLPLYNQDFDSDYPAVYTRLKQDIEAADAVLLVTPEYNRSFPGVIKNAVDIASRPWGTNSFAGKPAGLIGISIGAIGTAVAQQHMRTVLSYLDVRTMNSPEAYLTNSEGMFDADGAIADANMRQFLQGWMDNFVAWVTDK